VTEHYDVVIAGGGIHGVGVAQAAACAGYSALLLEKTGLAAGTSSRSSKLVHGGLRYLEGYDFGLVRESLHERTILLKVAPELVKLRPFHIPVYPETSRRPLTLRAGLILYALLGGFHHGSSFRTLHRSEWDSLDGLNTQRLQAVFQYHDAQTNDVELTRAVMQSAIRLGAVLACPAEFLAAQLNPDYCAVQYREGGVDKHCTAGVLVNAGGPWAGLLDARIDPAPAAMPIELVQGAHLILEGSLMKGCYYMEAPQDRRAVFLLPWGEHSMLGTTEHDYTGHPADVESLEHEKNYLLEVFRHYFPTRSNRVVDSFAGLRVLPASNNAAFSRSREIMLPVDNPRRPRVVSIYGGKLTGYRATAQKVLHLLAHSLPKRKALAHTADVKLTPVD
jgi:glycerol-3-phosphate dehydrogenase